MSSRLATLSADPLLRNFAVDATQNAARKRKIASFLMPPLEVPSITGQYKEYSAEYRYKRAKTEYSPTTGATRIGFSAEDKNYTLKLHALDFPIPNAEKMEMDQLRNTAMYGAGILSEQAELSHEGKVIDFAKNAAAANSPVTHNFASSSVDPVKVFNSWIISMIKAGKNSADAAISIGPSCWLAISSNPNVRGRLGDVKKIKEVTLDEFSAMLFGKPQVELSLMVEDTADAGAAEDINFMFDASAFVFLRNEQPSLFDAAFGKSLRLMGNWMVPGSYEEVDGRGEVLKFDWSGHPLMTNSAGIKELKHSE